MKKSDILRLIKESDGRAVIVQERPHEHTSYMLYHDYRLWSLDKYMGGDSVRGVPNGTLTTLEDFYVANGLDAVLSNRCARIWR